MTKTNQLERGRDRLELTEDVLIDYINDGISINDIDIQRPTVRHTAPLLRCTND